MPSVEPEPFSVRDEAAAGTPEPAAEEEEPELKPLHASLTALRSEGAPEPAEPAACLPLGAAELANTG